MMILIRYSFKDYCEDVGMLCCLAILLENNEEWIEKQREKFSQICDISPQKTNPKRPNETATDVEEIPVVLGKRKKGPQERLIVTYPPTPLAEKQDVEDDGLVGGERTRERSVRHLAAYHG